MKKPEILREGDIWEVGKKLYYYDGNDELDITAWIDKERFLNMIEEKTRKLAKKCFKKFINKRGEK